MTTAEDDLNGLITELDGLHWHDEDHNWCSYCLAYGIDENWPCHTRKIVDKYKRRAHRRQYIVAASQDRNFAWGTGPPPTEYSVTIKPRGNTVHRAATPAECHTWIDQQYEEKQ